MKIGQGSKVGRLRQHQELSQTLDLLRYRHG
jgi:hypothetical protein